MPLGRKRGPHKPPRNRRRKLLAGNGRIHHPHKEPQKTTYPRKITPQIAKLFRAAAQAETVHAHAHLRVMDGIKSTKENLAEAIKGEGFEFQQMYPEYINQAEEEKNKAAINSFRNASAVEKIHHGLYSGALSRLEAGADLPSSKILVCEICGNTVLGNAPEKCLVCGAPKNKFKEIE